MRTLVGFALGLFVRLWAATWRVRVLGAARAFGTGGPLVFAFWHGRQLALLGARRRQRAVTLVSWSHDGALQAGAMRALGLHVVRGSSSRGGAAGLRGIARRLRGGAHDAVFAVDGPRGPAGRAKPGAARLAALVGAQLVPVGSAASRSLCLTRAWDDFEIPLPFARVVIQLGEPMPADVLEGAPGRLDAALSDVMLRARSALGPPGPLASPALPSSP